MLEAGLYAENSKGKDLKVFCSSQCETSLVNI